MKLEPPPTIRAPRKDEMKHRTDFDELMEKRKYSNIVEGFELKKNFTKQLLYDFSAQININNSRLLELIFLLAETLPEKLTINFGPESHPESYSHFAAKSKIIEQLRVFKNTVVKDAQMEIALVSNTGSHLTELIITSSKYIRYSGSNESGFRSIMNQFGLKEIRRLEFVDEYPRIIVPLDKVIPGISPMKEVLVKLDDGLR